MEYVGIVEEAEEGYPPKIREVEGTVRHLRSRSSEFFEEGEPVFEDRHGIHRTRAICEWCDGEMLPGDKCVICPHCGHRELIVDDAEIIEDLSEKGEMEL